MDSADNALVIVDVINVLVSENHFLVLLKERGDNQRVIPISVGIFEANGIIMAMEGVKTKRPFTYDIVKTILEGIGARVDHLVISKLEENIYYGILFVESGGKIKEYDIRPSDGIAISLRFKCPIYVAEAVFRQVSSDNKNELLEEAEGAMESYSPIGQDSEQFADEEEEEIEESFFPEEIPEPNAEIKDIVAADNIETEILDLQKKLESAVADEQYEQAALIRDRINDLKRKFGRN